MTLLVLYLLGLVLLATAEHWFWFVAGAIMPPIPWFYCFIRLVLLIAG